MAIDGPIAMTFYFGVPTIHRLVGSAVNAARFPGGGSMQRFQAELSPLLVGVLQCTRLDSQQLD